MIKLNDKIWQGMTLKPRVRAQLIKIALEFVKFCDLDPDQVQDLVFTGSMASTTWRRDSDLDLHLVLDLDQIDCDLDPRDYFDTKRRLWNQNHRILIYGHEVEVYVEDQDDDQPGARYSLSQDQWLTQPQATDRTEVVSLKDLETWLARALVLVRQRDPDGIDQFLTDLKAMRSQSLRLQGEQGKGNLVYKQLRSMGLLRQLMRMRTRLRDRALGLVR